MSEKIANVMFGAGREAFDDIIRTVVVGIKYAAADSLLLDDNSKLIA